jgi:diguanylate cyclase (GGDEF)-like protein
VDIFVTLLLLGSGVCLFAGMQFTLFGLIRREEQVFLAFGFLSLLLGIYMLLSAQWYHADNIEAVSNIARGQMAIVCLIYPLFIWFLALFFDLKFYYKFLITLSIIFGALFIINFWSPHSFLYKTLSPDVPITLPWGEVLNNFKTEIAPIAWLYYAATYTVFGWSIYQCFSIWKIIKPSRVISITSYLILQFLFIIHAELIDNLNLQSVYLGEFAFLILVILVSIAFAHEVRSRSRTLEEKVLALRAETTRREGYEGKLKYMALHDYLTDLPNRRAISQKLDEMLKICTKSNTYGAMLLMDLDQFKFINDSLGHDIGDRLLQMVSQRLRDTLPVDHVPVRLGGDEFAILFGGLSMQEEDAEKDAVSKAEVICNEIIKPYRIFEHELVIGASIGIALFNSEAQRLSDILKQADMALYRAKSAGRNTIKVFAPKLKKDVDRRLIIEKGLREAIESNEVRLVFQPQVNISNKFVGAEVLARWKHPEFGYIPPREFITIAEETGLIYSLGEYIFHQTCSCLRNWNEQNYQIPERLSINVSPWQFDSPGFTHMVKTVLDETNVEPYRINIEITESTFMRNIDTVASKINELTGIGITFSIDDFGTGYSALAWLKNLSLHELKIDKLFVRDLPLPNNDKLIETIIAIADHMGMNVVAEGVETEEQFHALKSMGCHIFQGDLISPPLNENEFVNWTSTRHHVTETSATITQSPH